LEKSKKEFEEKEQEQLKRQNSRRKNEAKRIKAKERRMERMKKIGLTEIDQRFHQLVGKYKYRLKIPGNVVQKLPALWGIPVQGLILQHKKMDILLSIGKDISRISFHSRKLFFLGEVKP
jgi:hypothetical protein